LGAELEVPSYMVHAHKISKSGSRMPGARYKLLELVERHNLLTRWERSIICLADGGGTYAATLLHICPEAQLLFNTLSPLDQLRAEQLGNTLPAALMCKHISSHRVTDLSTTGVRFGDLTHPETWRELIDHVEQSETVPNLVTFDMESIPTSYPNVLRFLAEFILRSGALNCVLKTFSSTDYDTLNDLVNTLSNVFKVTVIDKPGFSSYFSKEIFLVCAERVEWNASPGTLPLRGLVNQLASRSCSNDYHQVANNLIKQVHWRRELRLCHSLEGYVQEQTGETTCPISRLLKAVIHQLIAVIQVRSSKSYPMDIASQHMLIGQTMGKMMVWEEIISAIMSVGTLLRLWVADFFSYLEHPHTSRNLDKERILIDGMKELVGGTKDRRIIEQRYYTLGLGLIVARDEEWKDNARLWSICTELIRENSHHFHDTSAAILSDLENSHQLIIGYQKKKRALSLQKNWCLMFSLTTNLISTARDALGLKTIRLITSNTSFHKDLITVGYPSESKEEGATSVYLGMSALTGNLERRDWDEALVIIESSLDYPPTGFHLKTLLRVPIFWSEGVETISLASLKKKKSKRGSV
jgi:23S rRNA U2552 (ribose-2'-O)-methylase RlmE/FtsJ